MTCRHCQRREASRPRGLCGTCYNDGAVRSLFPAAVCTDVEENPLPERKPGWPLWRCFWCAEFRCDRPMRLCESCQGEADARAILDEIRGPLAELPKPLRGRPLNDDGAIAFSGTAQALICACCGEESTNPGQFVKDGRWVCCAECRKNLPNVDSYDDLAASGGIVDAP